MKKLTAIFIFLSPILSMAQISVEVSGNSTDPNKKTPLFFYEIGAGRPVLIDSALIAADGTYQKKLSVKSAGSYLIGFSEIETSPFWVDQQPVEINFSTAPLPVIKGDVNSDLMNLFNQAIHQYHASMSSQDPKFDRRKAGQEYRSKLIALIQKYHDVPALVHLLNQFDFKEDRAFLKEAGAKLLSANPEHSAVKNYVNDITRLDAGQPATEVTFLDTNGIQKSLKDFIRSSKFTLVDYWGTYCVPCREGIPGIKKLYAQYRSKGLEILTISLDTKDGMWKKSLSEEDMPWPQGRTEDGGQKVMMDYRFNGIPYLALFDQEGNIVALDLHHDALEAKLKELMGEPEFITEDTIAASKPGGSKAEKELMKKILNQSTLASYQKVLSKQNENTFKVDYLNAMESKIKMKAYQVSKIGWSLSGYFNRYHKVLNTPGLSVLAKTKALRENDQNQLFFLRMVLEPDQYKQYLNLRLSKQLSL